VIENVRVENSGFGIAVGSAARVMINGSVISGNTGPGIEAEGPFAAVDKRELQVEHIRAQGWPLATVVSPTATIGIGSTIGAGTFVGHHCHVGPLARIGQCCILNTGCIVEHDREVGDYTHVSVNATLAGNCRLGRFVFLGAGATVIDNCSIGDDMTRGAGSVVTQSLSVRGTYAGVPARLLRDNRHAP